MADRTTKMTDDALRDADVINPHTKETWVYSDTVKDHFFRPKNILMRKAEDGEFSAEGIVGSPACGDSMWIGISVEDDRVKDMKWRTFGCGSAIASTSMFSVMLTENGGMKLDDALAVKPQDIMGRLGGLPNRKIHCSVLADKAFRKAVNNHFRNTGQHERIEQPGAKIVDPDLNITDHDIEEAVLEGATDLEMLQKKLKVGIGNPDVIPEIEELIRFYSEKYYG